jgi:serine/threonine protein kinase/tetratricopeptide (TPR) repeat protein
MTGHSTDQPSRSSDEVSLTDVVIFAEEPLLSDATVEPLLQEMGAAWRGGHQTSVEEFLALHPELVENPDAVLRLICEEICLREETGTEVQIEDYVKRFPRWQKEVQSLLECRQLMQVKTDAAVGLSHTPTLADFNLLTELGEGAQGQVYLATQPALADRPVVLKITRCHGEEHRALARLQHTHIVPLYWAQDDVAKDRRILCMPYFGNVTLGDLFKAVKDKLPARRTGQDILDVLEKGRASSAVSLPASGPARQFLARAPYVEAVAWMGACLADALHYAHERGLLHLDIKPTNVLLAADGQPMLLDFHLARGPIRPDGVPPRGMGGTPYFMSPEQQLAMEAVCGGRPVAVAVDGRSDVYSLGLVLYQALSGQVPMTSPPPQLDECNSRVSVGLADIIQKCLARVPRARYKDAAALASDLRRHLAHLPLKGVPNRNWPERWRKWRKRKPHALSISVLVAVLLLTCVSVGGYVLMDIRQRLQGLEKALLAAKTQVELEDFEGAINTLRSGQADASTTPGGDGYEPRFQELLEVARHSQLLNKLHSLVDRLRFLTGAEKYTKEVLEKLEPQCRELWNNRQRLLKGLQFDKQKPEHRLQLYRDVLDLAVIWAGLRVRIARPGDEHHARKFALKILEQAEADLPEGSPILLAERAAYARALGMDNLEIKALAELRKPSMQPHTAWEFCALGRASLNRGEFEKAAGLLDKAVDRAPHDFWSHFYRGKCAYHRHEYTEAAASFWASIGAAKGMSAIQQAPSYYNLALAEAALGRKEASLRHRDRALELDPEIESNALISGSWFFEWKP